MSMIGATDQATVTRHITKVLQPGEVQIAQMEVWPIQYSQEFRSMVTVDADLGSNNSFKKLSDMYPDPRIRTFPLVGTLTFSAAFASTAQIFDAPSLERTACANPPQPVIQAMHVWLPPSAHLLFKEELPTTTSLVHAVRK
ncbi:MAG: hypothetical protein ACRDRL_05570 [Sciscionella sp.]